MQRNCWFEIIPLHLLVEFALQNIVCLQFAQKQWLSSHKMRTAIATQSISIHTRHSTIFHSPMVRVALSKFTPTLTILRPSA